MLESSSAHRSPRFAELDAKIRAEAEQRQNSPHPKRKPRRRSTSPLPAAVRKEITRAARELNRQYCQLFKADPKLKDRAAGCCDLYSRPSPADVAGLELTAFRAPSLY